MVNKSLLAGTLCVTFAAGGYTGYQANELRRPDRAGAWTVDSVYAKEFEALRRKGYSEEELHLAREIYGDYFRAYDVWWQKFLETYTQNFDAIDRRFERRIEDLDAQFMERTGWEPPQEQK
jgi:hypothetical protein